MFTWTTVKHFEETPIQFVKLTKTIWKMFLDIDECFSYINNCRHKNSYCTNTYESFLCTCGNGYSRNGLFAKTNKSLSFWKIAFERI